MVSTGNAVRHRVKTSVSEDDATFEPTSLLMGMTLQHHAEQSHFLLRKWHFHPVDSFCLLA